MNITPAEREHVPEILDLWHVATTEATITDNEAALGALLAFDPEALLVARVNGEIVGTIIATWDGWRGGIYRLAVHPDHRRKGIATALVAAAEARLRTLGAARIALIVVADEVPARCFWEASGYTEQPDRLRFTRDLDRR